MIVVRSHVFPAKFTAIHFEKNDYNDEDFSSLPFCKMIMINSENLRSHNKKILLSQQNYYEK